MSKFEIERKYHVQNIKTEELIEIIKKKGGKYKGQNKQNDIYFNIPGRDSLASRECLRIRDSEMKKEITYKPPTKKEEMNSGFYAKKEVNLAVLDIKLAKTLLKNLGCNVLAEVNKKRMHFKLDKFNIFIDNVRNIGLFLEIELLDDFNNIQKNIEEIDNLMDSFGLDSYIIENKPYRDLVIEREKGGEVYERDR